jgi:hypothetical protein
MHVSRVQRASQPACLVAPRGLGAERTAPCARGRPSPVGVAWGAVIGGYDGYAASGRLGVSTARVAGRAVLTSSVSFASFLGCYSGTSCLAERVRGRDDWVSRFTRGIRDLPLHA